MFEILIKCSRVEPCALCIHQILISKMVGRSCGYSCFGFCQFQSNRFTAHARPTVCVCVGTKGCISHMVRSDTCFACDALLTVSPYAFMQSILTRSFAAIRSFRFYFFISFHFVTSTSIRIKQLNFVLPKSAGCHFCTRKSANHRIMCFRLIK